jgi:hypothetical protein
MKNTLFNPKRMELPDHLILIPQFWDKDYYENLKKKAYGCIELIHSDLLIFGDYTVIVGFLGYPHILTLLEFIEGVREKEIYFLGTAGSMNPAIDRPMPLVVDEIYATDMLEQFGESLSFKLKPFENSGMKKARGVTVDVIQRETQDWLRLQLKRGLDFVEMELYPLRVYLEKPFRAIVVASDLIKDTGIQVFPDKKLLAKEFVAAYELIVKAVTG